MEAAVKAIAKIVRLIAGFGAGTVSTGMTYEPKMPKKLIKK